MIHARPNCFHCETPLESLTDAVFAPPLCDHEDCASAIFHPICLMEWRDRREEMQKRLETAKQTFLRHLNGECSCQDDQ